MIRRAWQVLADPPTSKAAEFLRFLIPLETVFVSLRFLPGWDFSWPSTTLMDVVWLYAILWFVRQRDQARAETIALRKDQDCSCDTPDGQRILAWPSTPDEVFVRCGVCSGRVTPARKARAATRDRPEGW